MYPYASNVVVRYLHAEDIQSEERYCAIVKKLSVRFPTFYFFWEANGVLKVFPNMFLMALHFVPYALPKGVLLQPT
jgi:hypothetical protein